MASVARMLVLLLAGLCFPVVVVAWVDVTAPKATLHPGVVTISPRDTMPMHWRTISDTASLEQLLDILQGDPDIVMAMSILGLRDAPIMAVSAWPAITRLYLGSMAEEAYGLTLPPFGRVYLREELLRDTDLETVRSVTMHELIHVLETRNRFALGRDWRRAGTAPVADPTQYGFRNVYEQRAEAGEGALKALLALERGAPPTRIRNYLLERERAVPGTILMLRWMLSQPVLEDRPWRRMTWFSQVAPVPAPWGALRPEEIRLWD